ncbi:unnamed protein product [Calicophoron daubneyi]|uniref:Tetraspanin n=1 Tax=Calicophoron daubneyi TaxID=300641 RepID=A0AAV2T1F5_CALDB
MCVEKFIVSCTKILLIALNLFFVLLGLLAIGFSCWALLAPKDFSVISGPESKKHSWPELVHFCACIVLTVGGILVLLASTACSGAALENRCLLVTFFTLLCGILTGCMVAGVLIATFRNELFTLAVNRMSIGVQHEYGVSPFWTELMDLLQSKLFCCAVDNQQADLYTRSAWYQSQQGASDSLGAQSTFVNDKMTNNVPASCCLLTMDGSDYMNLTACQTDVPNAKTNRFLSPYGCAPALVTLLQSSKITLAIVLTSMILLLVISMSVFT